MYYKFEWDPNKEKRNIQKHRMSFRRAMTVFRDSNQLTNYDEVHSEYEDRWITIGIDNTGILSVVIHTFESINENEIEVRIISARKAIGAEYEQYRARV